MKYAQAHKISTNLLWTITQFPSIRQLSWATLCSNTVSLSIVWVPLIDQFWCLFGWRETVLEHLTPNTESWTAWRRRTRRNTRQRTGRHRQVSLATGTGGNRPTGSSAPDVSACRLCGHPSTPPGNNNVDKLLVRVVYEKNKDTILFPKNQQKYFAIVGEKSSLNRESNPGPLQTVPALKPLSYWDLIYILTDRLTPSDIFQDHKAEQNQDKNLRPAVFNSLFIYLLHIIIY